MARRKSTATTITEVAAEAGVSITSVSKVLHGSQASIRVSEATANHIRQVAQRLNYVPNANARSLRTRKSETIGLVFENLGHISDGPQFNVMLLDGIGRAVFDQHYRLTILTEIDYQDSVRQLGDGRLDGLVWCKLRPEPEILRQLEAAHIPCVVMCAPPPSGLHSLSFFGCDNQGGAKALTKRMIELGHRRILFVLEEREEDTPDALARLAGVREALEEADLSLEAEDVVVWSYAADEFESWWRSKPPQTAVFAWNEGVAGNVLLQAARCGVDVPGQLSVVGFDSTQYCDSTRPRLTAVRQPVLQMATAAASHLFKLIQGEPLLPTDTVFPCSIDERESLGPVPAGSRSIPQ